MEKSMRRLKDEPFDNQNIFKFLQTISKDLDDILVVKESNEKEENSKITYEESLEHLSMSIRNRMKVEAEENFKLPKNSIMEQLSKFEHIFNELKIEE